MLYYCAVRVILVRDYDQVSVRAAQFVADEIKKNPSLVLGLPTGSTPVGMYKELVKLFQSGTISFKKASAFQLDEYVGLAPDHPQSYQFFLKDHFLDNVDFPASNAHFLDGMSQDIPKTCDIYETSIRKSGGLGLVILGIGRDGHIAFNEPGSSLSSRTRLKTLDHTTIRDNARFFDQPEDVPKFAVTMGVGTIMDSKMVLLLASGRNKAQVVSDVVEGPMTAMVTGSILQMHPKVTVIIDGEAATRLRRLDYYTKVEEMWDEKLSV